MAMFACPCCGWQWVALLRYCAVTEKFRPVYLVELHCPDCLEQWLLPVPGVWVKRWSQYTGDLDRDVRHLAWIASVEEDRWLGTQQEEAIVRLA